MTTTPPQPQPARPRTRPWRGVLYGLLLIAAVFAAWQANDLLQSTKDEPDAPARRPPAPRPSWPPSKSRIKQAPYAVSSTRSASGSQPATSITDILDDTEVEPLPPDAEDPVGIAPPPGAVGRSAHVIRDSSVVARYGWEGALADAVKHYERAFEAQGYRLLDSSADEEGRRYIKGEGALRRFVVVLRTDPQDAKMVSIEITVIRMK